MALNAAGQAILTLNNVAGSYLTIGAHHIQVSYPGDGNYGMTSTSSDFILNVQKDGTSVSVAATPVSPSVFGQPLTFTATVLPAVGLGQPSGTVTFYDGAATPANQIGLPAALNTSTGIATVTVSNLPVNGVHTIRAVYSGDTNYSQGGTGSATNGVGTLAYTINKANTQATLAVSPASPVYGQALTFTSTVTVQSPSTASPPTGGTVSFFYDGGNLFGSQPVNASGVAVFTVAAPTLAAGPHQISAVYNGDNVSYAGSAFVTLSNYTVGLAPTQAALSGTPAAGATYGQPVTFTATITAAAPSNAAAPTQGNVSFFYDGNNSLGTAQTLVGNVATLSIPAFTLSVGPHTISAVYSGDGINYAQSPAGTLSYSVNPVGTSTAVSATPASNPAYGQPLTFTASVTANSPSNAAPPTSGTVTFYNGAAIAANQIGTPQSVNGSGVAVLTLTNPTLAVGSHTISAVYSGDGATYGASNAGTLSNYIVVKAGTTAVVTDSPASTVFGQTVTFTASVSANSPSVAAAPSSGTVTFFDGGSQLGTPQPVGAGGIATLPTTALSVTTHSITAVYNGDGVNYAASIASAPVNYTVTQAGSTISIQQGTPNPSFLGQAVAFTVTVLAQGPSSVNPTSGTINFFNGAVNGGGTFLGSTTLAGTNVGVFQYSGLAIGTFTINAAYVANSSYGSSDTSASPATQTVVKNDTITITPSSNSPVFGQVMSYTVQVSPAPAGTTGTPSQTVTLSVDGNAVTGSPATLDNTGKFTFTNVNLGSVGTHTLAATYSGDASFISNSGSITQTVAKAATQTIVTATPVNSATNPVYGQPLTFTATVTASSPSSASPPASGTVSFFDGGNALGTAQNVTPPASPYSPWPTRLSRWPVTRSRPFTTATGFPSRSVPRIPRSAT